MNLPSLREPGDYIESLQKGCILDPSIFYSAEYIQAAEKVLSAIAPRRIFIPKSFLAAFDKASWTSFFTTMTLWAGKYENLSEAWRTSDVFFERFKTLPIEIEEGVKTTELLAKAMFDGKKRSPLENTLFDITAFSLASRLPILVATHSKPRLIELLNSKIKTVFVEPLGEWASSKKEFLLAKGGRETVFALNTIGGGFVFIDSLLAGNPLPTAASGMILVATLIDGS